MAGECADDEVVAAVAHAAHPEPADVDEHRRPREPGLHERHE
jgi:hypothetical protein